METFRPFVCVFELLWRSGGAGHKDAKHKRRRQNTFLNLLAKANKVMIPLRYSACCVAVVLIHKRPKKAHRRPQVAETEIKVDLDCKPWADWITDGDF